MGFSLPVSQKLAVADSASSPGGDRLRPGQLAPPPPAATAGFRPLEQPDPQAQLVETGLHRLG
jgi:hypothetical protein